MSPALLYLSHQLSPLLITQDSQRLGHRNARGAWVSCGHRILIRTYGAKIKTALATFVSGLNTFTFDSRGKHKGSRSREDAALSVIDLTILPVLPFL